MPRFPDNNAYAAARPIVQMDREGSIIPAQLPVFEWKQDIQQTIGPTSSVISAYGNNNNIVTVRPNANLYFRKVYAGILIDDCDPYRIQGFLEFRLAGRNVSEIPFDYRWSTSDGVLVDGSQIPRFPHTTRRANIGIVNIPDYIETNPAPDSFQVLNNYNDGTDIWHYLTTLFPIHLAIACDEIGMRITATSATSGTFTGMASFMLACHSQSLPTK